MAPKRKRAATLSKQTPTLDVAQPSSRDASGEDAEDPILQEVTDAKQRATESRSSKRSRSNNGAVNGSEKGNRKSSSGNDTDDDAEDKIEHGESGERGTMKMEDPPKAGLVDPVGYHTNPPPTDRAVRVYADGVFDLFHLGHMRVLQQAKQAFPNTYLIVGVTGDKETHRRKGLTVLSGKERAESVRHCKWVDEVVEDCPWIIADAPEFIEQHQIDYVAHDDLPYGADEGDDIYAPIKKSGKFLVTQRTEGVSTTGIITKIVRDYDQYISRQLKRGTPRQELNVSWLKKNELDIKRSLGEVRESIRTNWTTTGQELGKELRNFWQSSRPSSPAPAARNTSQTVLAHMPHLEIPKSATGLGGGGGPPSADFATGYSLGLIGGVRGWMNGSRHTLNSSRPDSPDSEADSPRDRRSPDGEPSRGRKRNVQDEVDQQVVDEMVPKP